MRRTHGSVHIRVGLNSGDVVVRAIDSSLHMDYTAVGQTTHLAARMEQMAMPGSALDGPDLGLAEGIVQVTALGPVLSKGWRPRWRCLSSSVPAPPGGACRRLRARGLTRFVGRQAEFKALLQALERAGAATARSWRSLASPAWARLNSLPLPARVYN